VNYIELTGLLADREQRPHVLPQAQDPPEQFRRGRTGFIGSDLRAPVKNDVLMISIFRAAADHAEPVRRGKDMNLAIQLRQMIAQIVSRISTRSRRIEHQDSQATLMGPHFRFHDLRMRSQDRISGHDVRRSSDGDGVIAGP
jgi:hypothetical protein